jgi:hypothetical protein
MAGAVSAELVRRSDVWVVSGECSAYETPTKLVAALSEQDATIGGPVEFNAGR